MRNSSESRSDSPVGKLTVAAQLVSSLDTHASQGTWQVLLGQPQDQQEEQGVQEQTCWGSHALGAGHPGAHEAAHELEGLWAGRDGKGNAWNNKLGHFIFTKKLKIGFL